MDQKESRVLNISLWVVQGLLTAAFGMAGFLKISSPIEKLAESGMSFVNSYSEETVRFIGACEILGALGLILPGVLKIKPMLTPLAALGLAVIMILATWYHLTHNEQFISTIIILSLAAFVAWGRFRGAK
ncbi:MAG: DoxX family protein [Bacteroidetes bacterium]|nr:DoxX family protein [Bacteroidota bacterium]